MSRVTLTPDQYALFQQNQRQAGNGAPKKAGAPRVKRKKSELPENILESQVCSFLASRGWVNVRQHVGTFTPYRVLIQLEQKTMTLEQAKRNIVRVGAKGDLDWMSFRLAEPSSFIAVPVKWKIVHPFQLLFWDAKAPGKKPTPEQLDSLRKWDALGVPAAVWDDFDGDWDTSFLPWYKSRYE